MQLFSIFKHLSRIEQKENEMESKIPVARLNSGYDMPVVGLGTASYPPAPAEVFHQAILDTIGLGYHHFDTASLYGTEKPLGVAVAEAIKQGLVKREELFITTKLWCTDAHAGRVVPALQESLRNLQLEYVDLYLIHWPLSLKPRESKFPIKTEDVVLMDFKAVWGEMEECQRLGLTKSIGVSNFSCKKLEQILSFASIPPSVNQVEVNPVWQQKKLIEFAKDKGIKIFAYSPLGSNGTPWGTPQVLECNVLKEIASSKGKSLAQVSLRWIYQQGAGIIVKSFNKERMKENIDIFDWELTPEELHEISLIPQGRVSPGDVFISENGPIKSQEDLWDGEI